MEDKRLNTERVKDIVSPDRNPLSFPIFETGVDHDGHEQVSGLLGYNSATVGRAFRHAKNIPSSVVDQYAL